MTTAGMTMTTVDDAGRLVEFQAVLPRTDDKPGDTPAPPWPTLFAAAGLNLAQFQPVEPEWLPRAYADARAAWEGPLREGNDIRGRVEAASYRGRAVFFRLVVPGTPKDSGPQPTAANAGASFWKVAATALSVTLMCGSLVLARHNLRAGRGDRRGASRTALFMLMAYVAAWIISGRHFLSLETERGHFYGFLSFALLNTGLAWLFYIALEPYVRRFAPEILISWTRVIGGQIRDPRVGRDLLIGVAVGTTMALLGITFMFVAPLLGEPPATPRSPNTVFLLEARLVAGGLLRVIPNAMSNAMAFAVVFVLARAVTRRVWAGALVTMIVLAVFVMSEGSGDRWWASLAFTACFVVPLTLTLVYVGLLPAAAAFLTNQAVNNSPLTLDLTKPYAGTMMLTVILVVGLAAFGYYATRKGQPLIGQLLGAD